MLWGGGNTKDLHAFSNQTDYNKNEHHYSFNNDENCFSLKCVLILVLLLLQQQQYQPILLIQNLFLLLLLGHYVWEYYIYMFHLNTF